MNATIALPLISWNSVIVISVLVLILFFIFFVFLLLRRTTQEFKEGMKNS